VSRGSSSSSARTSAPGSSSVASTAPATIVWSASPLAGTVAGDAQLALISAFEQAYPDIHVTLVSAPAVYAPSDNNTDADRAALATGIAGGSSTPDVFMGDVVWPGQFGAHGLAVPLSKYLPASYWSRFAPGLVQGATYNGQIYGSPLTGDQGLLYYRKDLLAQEHMTVPQTWEQIARIARTTAEAIGLGRPLADDEIVLLDGWHAGTYGIPDEKTIEAIRLCARLEGVITDPVYEGKSMAALIDLVQDGRIEPGARVLYAHLGGQPALNGYAGAF